MNLKTLEFGELRLQHTTFGRLAVGDRFMLHSTLIRIKCATFFNDEGKPRNAYMEDEEEISSFFPDDQYVKKIVET